MSEIKREEVLKVIWEMPEAPKSEIQLLEMKPEIEQYLLRKPSDSWKYEMLNVT